MTPTPLPAWLLAALGTLIALIAALAASLGSPWHEVALAIVALASWLGVPVTLAWIRRDRAAAVARHIDTRNGR